MATHLKLQKFQFVAEQIMADVIISNLGEIQDNNDNMIQGVNEF